MRKRDAVLGAAALTALGAAGAMKLNDILFRPMVPPPVEVDLPCRRLSIPSGDALLSGALLGEEGPRGRLILAHGMGVSWDYYLPEIRRFTALGYQVLAFSYRGYPGSGGRFQGFPQAARDVAAGMNFAGEGPLTLWGHSMGAYAVCAALALTERPVERVVACAPFDVPAEAIRQLARQGIPGGQATALAVNAAQRLRFGADAALLHPGNAGTHGGGDAGAAGVRGSGVFLGAWWGRTEKTASDTGRGTRDCGAVPR